MTTSSISTLVLIALAAVLAPILSELTGPAAIPEIVIQIGFGTLHVFIDHPASLWRVPFFAVLMLAARGIPVPVLYRDVLPRVERLPMALFSATGLPLIVVITSIATAEDRILPVNAAALVAAGMVTVLLFPAVGFWRMTKVRSVGEPR